MVRPAWLKGLRFRVAVVFVLGSTIPLGVVGYFAVRTADAVIAAIVTSQLENVAADKQELLQRWMAERKADVAVLARSAVMRSLDVAEIAPYLALVGEQYRAYRRFLVLGPQGRTVYDSAEGQPRPADDEAGYREAVRHGTYVSPVHWDPSHGEAVFSIFETIRDPRGEPAGVVCAVVDTQAILAQVLNVSLGETGECYLVDGEGTFLAHKQPERVLRDTIARSESFFNLFDEHVGPIYTDYRGIAVLGAFRRVAGMPWYVVVEQDRDEAFASADRLAWNISAAVAATVLVAIGLSWGLASYVASPILALSDAADALSQGDFARALAAAPRPRTDEIGVLDQAFRTMANRLWERQARLQEKIGVTEEELRKSEEKLRHTLEAAARSERLAALGRLAAGVAHEIRTPLTSLKLFLQSILEDIQLGPDQAEDFDVAMRQVRRMEATIHHFLSFARPQEPCLTEVNFPKLIDDALLVVQPRANQQEVEIEKRLAGVLPKVEGDVRQLGEVLVNLLVNALEVMPDGGRLAISVAPAPPEPPGTGPCRVRIDVSDSGPGIPEAVRHRLFEPFFTTKASGSGLGLAIVQGTIDRHGGTIVVDSRPGQGATFSIFLPASDARGPDHAENPGG
ncbi:MAG: cache domain-containing protein [Thermoguttaceae bacterium]|nr:cache domain-containing protein [Thermoguttaceae bacterium]